MMIRGQTLLLDLTVEHGYFSAPGDCRLQFDPEPQSEVWLGLPGLTLRRGTNWIKLYCEDDRLGAARKTAPVALGFWVTGEDPLFGSFTGELEPGPELAQFGDLGPVAALFDLASAELDSDGRAVAGSWVPCCPLDAGLRRPARQGFRVSLPIAWPPQAVQPFLIRLNARSLVWKYLLAKDDWEGDAPRLVERSSGPDAEVTEPVGFMEGPVEPLADGRSALTFLSSKPLPIQDRSPRRIAMVADAGVNQGRVIFPTLPNPSAANLARAGPGKAELVAEILVPS